MKFREATTDDLQYCCENSVSGGKYTDPDETVSHSVALEHEGVVLGIGGIMKITDSTAWGYVDMTQAAKEHLYTVYRVIRDWMNVTCKLHGITRLQAWVEVGIPERCNFVEHLGFEREGGPMRDFVEVGKPAYMYVKHMDIEDE